MPRSSARHPAQRTIRDRVDTRRHAGSPPDTPARPETPPADAELSDQMILNDGQTELDTSATDDQADSIASAAETVWPPSRCTPALRRCWTCPANSTSRPHQSSPASSPQP